MVEVDTPNASASEAAAQITEDPELVKQQA